MITSDTLTRLASKDQEDLTQYDYQVLTGMAWNTPVAPPVYYERIAP